MAEQDKLLIRLHVYDTDLSVRIPREDEEIRMVDEAIRKNNIEIVSPRYNEDMCTEPYFSRYPFFGLPTEVEDCDIIYHE